MSKEWNEPGLIITQQLEQYTDNYIMLNSVDGDIKHSSVWVKGADILSDLIFELYVDITDNLSPTEQNTVIQSFITDLQRQLDKKGEQ